MYHWIWSTAGMVVQAGRRLSRSGREKLDTPIAFTRPFSRNPSMARQTSLFSSRQSLPIWPWDQMGKDCREENKEVWRAMEGFLEKGRVKAIGVSNFSRPDLESLLPACTTIPAVDQIQWYIGYDVSDTVAACAEHGIVVEAYSPFAHGRIVNHPDIVDMGRRYGVSAPQLSIRYLLQKGAVPLPKATTPDHITANAEVDFEISDADMAILDG